MRQDDLEGVALLQLGDHIFKAHATGARGGFRWRISDDDVLIMIGSPKRDWTISVRYLSAGLWERGLEALRAARLSGVVGVHGAAAGRLHSSEPGRLVL
jgi:hypothetical protein